MGPTLGYLAASLALVALVGCGPAAQPGAPSTEPRPGQAQAQPKYGGSLRMAGFELRHMDPHRTIGEEYTSGPLYNGLVTYKPLTAFDDYVVTPDLAESWETSPDGLVYTFKIRQGAKFHNGDPVTIEDIVFSLERLRAKDPEALKAYLLDAVDKIEAAGPSTLRLVLKEPYAPLLTLLGQPFPVIVSKKLVEQNNNSLKQVEAGSGPFKLLTYERGARFVMEKYPDYWDKGKPYLDTIEYIIMPDYAARTAAFRAGQIDIHDWYRGADVLQIPKSNPDAIQEKWIGLFPMQVAFNVAKTPFNDLRVRRAFSLIMDRWAIAKSVNVIGPGYLSAPLPRSVGGKWVIPEEKIEETLPYYKRDAAKAKQLLAEAGLSNGFKTSLIIRRDLLNYVSMAEIFKENLKEIGVDMEIKGLEVGAQTRALVARDFEIIGSARATPVGDPDDGLWGAFFSGSGQNYGDVRDKKLDELLIKQRRTLDERERKKLLDETQVYLADQAYWLFISDADYASAWHPYVKSFRRTFARHVILEEAWLDKDK
ncbi:MAG: ABC transporter substrate-binding protein [Chloroflexi bacterium]|nr:ABC transporter substrate-binding protein [Chloroflexota bacterium]